MSRQNCANALPSADCGPVPDTSGTLIWLAPLVEQGFLLTPRFIHTNIREMRGNRALQHGALRESGDVGIRTPGAQATIRQIYPLCFGHLASHFSSQACTSR